MPDTHLAKILHPESWQAEKLPARKAPVKAVGKANVAKHANVASVGVSQGERNTSDKF